MYKNKYVKNKNKIINKKNNEVIREYDSIKNNVLLYNNLFSKNKIYKLFKFFDENDENNDEEKKDNKQALRGDNKKEDTLTLFDYNENEKRLIVNILYDNLKQHGFDITEIKGKINEIGSNDNLKFYVLTIINPPINYPNIFLKKFIHLINLLNINNQNHQYDTDLKIKDLILNLKIIHELAYLLPDREPHEIKNSIIIDEIKNLRKKYEDPDKHNYGWIGIPGECIALDIIHKNEKKIIILFLSQMDLD